MIVKMVAMYVIALYYTKYLTDFIIACQESNIKIVRVIVVTK